MKKYVKLTIFCLIYSVGFQLLIQPNGLAPGGFSGIAVILNSFLPILPTGTFLFLINIPVLLVGWVKFGTKFIASTFYCTALNSLFMNLIDMYMEPITDDPMLATFGGAAITAFALGSILKKGATTGGMDIVVKLIKSKNPFIKTNKIFLMADALVVLALGLTLGEWEMAMYSAICVYVVSKIMDVVLYGTDEAKFVYIISKKQKCVSKAIVYKLEIGATLLNGKGAYLGEEKEIIMCVVKKRMYPQLETLVTQTDPSAFMIVSSAMEVFGEGYKNYGDHI